MAQSRGSYGVAPWVLYQSADPLRAVHARAGIDAVIVETPYERVRYEAYLDRLQGDRVTPEAVAKMRHDALPEIGFLVYAHSRSEDDRGFLAGFHSAFIIPSGGSRITNRQTVRFGPSDDFYDVGTFREQRWVGSITYRFALKSCSQRGTLHFSDGYGRHYAFPFDLTRYR